VIKLNENPDALVEVENPVYQSYDEICKDFFGKVVLITKINFGERNKILGGTVTWYTETNKKLYDKWGDCMESPEGDRCIVKALMPFDFYGGIL